MGQDKRKEQIEFSGKMAMGAFGAIILILIFCVIATIIDGIL